MASCAFVLSSVLSTVLLGYTVRPGHRGIVESSTLATLVLPSLKVQPRAPMWLNCSMWLKSRRGRIIRILDNHCRFACATMLLPLLVLYHHHHHHKHHHRHPTTTKTITTTTTTVAATSAAGSGCYYCCHYSFFFFYYYYYYYTTTSFFPRYAASGPSNNLETHHP